MIREQGFASGEPWPLEDPRFVILRRDALSLQFHLPEIRASLDSRRSTTHARRSRERLPGSQLGSARLEAAILAASRVL